MKLSEAIMLGSTLGPQCFELFQRGDATCAIGAAAKALNCTEEQVLSSDGKFPFLWLRDCCPDCSEEAYIHRWTRERIAEWVATVEPQEPEESGADIRKSQGISDFALNQHVTGGNWNG